jgi:hypothetical protein
VISTVAITAGADVGNDPPQPAHLFGFHRCCRRVDGWWDADWIDLGLGTATVLVTALTSDATPTEINKLLEAFGFSTTSALTNDRSITYTFHDGGNVGDVAPGAVDATTPGAGRSCCAAGHRTAVFPGSTMVPTTRSVRSTRTVSGRATVYSTATNETSIAIDPAAGFVFTTGTNGGGQFDTVFVHNIHTGALVGRR